MKNTRVIFHKTIIIVHNLLEQMLILSQIRNGGEEPAISQLALLHVKSGKASNKELRVFADIFWT